MRDLEQPNSTPPKRIIAAKHQPPWPKHQQCEQIKRRVKVREAVARRRLEDVDAVDVDVLVVGLVHDAREAIGHETGERAHEQKGREGDEENHEGRAKYGVNIAHDFEADIARAKKYFAQDAGHAQRGKVVAAEEGKGGEEAAVDDEDDDHELDKVHGHFFEAGDEDAPGRAEGEEGAHAGDEEEGFEGENVKGDVVDLVVVLHDSDNS